MTYSPSDPKDTHCNLTPRTIVLCDPKTGVQGDLTDGLERAGTVADDDIAFVRLVESPAHQHLFLRSDSIAKRP